MAVQNIFSYYNVTESQVQACTRFVNENNNRVYYQVQSATDASKTYTVWTNQHNCLVDNCAAGQVGRSCWHKRAVLAAAAIRKADRRAAFELDRAEAAAQELESESHENSARCQDGDGCYNRKPFQFMR